MEIPQSRQRALERGEGYLTLEERQAGWHFCYEFDEMVTDGEMVDDEGVCICGFDRRKVTGPRSPEQE